MAIYHNGILPEDVCVFKKAPNDIHAGKMLLLHCVMPKGFLSLESHEDRVELLLLRCVGDV